MLVNLKFIVIQIRSRSFCTDFLSIVRNTSRQFFYEPQFSISCNHSAYGCRCRCQCNILLLLSFMLFSSFPYWLSAFRGICLLSLIRIFIGMFIFLMGFSLFGYYNKITWWLTLFIYPDTYWKGWRNSHNWLTAMRREMNTKKEVLPMEWDFGLVQRGFASQSVWLSQF